jgi:4-amino-4-deoxy-L-arabinose transferase-like glycosyltransferase
MRYGGMLAPVERLLDALVDPARRERTCLWLMVAYAAVWTLYGVIAKSSQDLHPDMTEIAIWAREPALGYVKHPPLAAWLAGAWFAVFPASDWSFYLLAMVVAAVALWFAWHLAGDYLDGEKRVLAIAMLTLVPFFNFHALKFNANTVLLPTWAATAFCFLRSYERRSVAWAALAGLCAAAAMLGKYWSAFLLVGLVLAALLDSRRARYFRSAAPWVTVAVATVALAPHFVWLVTHDFLPFTYAVAVHARSAAEVARSVPGYLAGSVAYVALPVLLALGASRPGWAAAKDTLWPATPTRRLAACSFWFPLLLPAIAAPLSGIEITSLWSMSAWALLPVVLLSSPLIRPVRRFVVIVLAIALAMPPIMVAIAPAIALAIHQRGVAPEAAHVRMLAARVTQEWRRRTERPLRFVAGEYILVYGVAFYAADRPLAFPSNLIGTPPVDPALRARDGIAIVCRGEGKSCIDDATKLGGARTDLTITRSFFGIAGQPARYAIFIVLPRPLAELPNGPHA